MHTDHLRPRHACRAATIPLLITMILLVLLAGVANADAPAAAEGLLREKPPVIILKLDDLEPARGGDVPPAWRDLVDFLSARQVTSSIGMICRSIPDAKPAYVQWVKELHTSGKVEFWFHGWDHRQHDVNGTKKSEFIDRPLDEQIKRFADSQKLAHDTFGFYFQTFGPPDGAFNDDTLAALSADPHMKAIFYPRPMDPIGQKLNNAGKITVLDRVWVVGLEATTFVPDSAKFIEGYKKNLTREYFFLQGHPTHWNEQRLIEAHKIIEFLVSQKARFMTPSAYVAEMKEKSAKK